MCDNQYLDLYLETKLSQCSFHNKGYVTQLYGNSSYFLASGQIFLAPAVVSKLSSRADSPRLEK